MVKTTISATIFVSSPGDVDVERKAVSSTVARWNSRNADARGVTFNVWAWENNSIPDVGVDAQAVMNQQIPQDFDILVGIFWTRLGTPTGRAGSGTQEEIEDAIKQRGDSNSPHVAVYFKDGTPKLSSIDVNQLTRLREYQQSLQSRALAGRFDDVQELEAEIEKLLDRKALEYRGLRPDHDFVPNPSLLPSVSAADEKTNPYEDFGLFDFVEGGEARLNKAMSILNEITEKTQAFNENLTSVNNRLSELNRYGDASIKQTRPIVKEAAEGMNELSRFIDDRIEAYAESFMEAAEFSVMVVDVAQDFDDSEGDIASLKANVQALVSSGEEAIEAQEGLRESVVSLPRLDMSTNQAKRRLSATLERLNDAMKAGLVRMREV